MKGVGVASFPPSIPAELEAVMPSLHIEDSGSTTRLKVLACLNPAPRIIDHRCR